MVKRWIINPILRGYRFESYHMLFNKISSFFIIVYFCLYIIYKMKKFNNNLILLKIKVFGHTNKRHYLKKKIGYRNYYISNG